MFIELLKESSDLNEIESFLDLDEDTQKIIIGIGLPRGLDEGFEGNAPEIDSSKFLKELKKLKNSYKEYKKMEKSTDKLISELDKLLDTLDEDDKDEIIDETEIYDLPSLGDSLVYGKVSKEIENIKDFLSEYDSDLPKKYEKLINKYGIFPEEIEDWLSDLDDEYQEYLEA